MKATIRPSSFIFRSGTGSIVDLPDRESILMMGTAFWKGHETIREERLEAACGVDHFGSPIKKWDEKSEMWTGIASRDFPFMLMCPKCGKLFYRYGKNIDCPNCGVTAIPPRLVAACDKGHLHDFPWKVWCGCECSNPNIFLVARDKMATGIELGNSDTIVKCQNCNKQRSLMGALGELKFSHGTELSCFGNRPWIADNEDCDQKLRGFMRGASNLYFPVVKSSLSIPPFSKEIQKLVRKHKKKSSRRRWTEGKIREYIEFEDELQDLVNNGTYTIENLEKAFNVMYGKRDPHSSIKKEEWDTFTHDSRLAIGLGTNDDFKANVLDVSSSKLSDWFDVVLKVRKLREVVALQGFTRNQPYNGTTEDAKRIQYVNDKPNNWDLLKTKITKPYLNDEINLNWLPGVEQYGEGIFFKFNEKRLSEWMDQKDVISRWESIISNDSEIPLEKDGIDTKDPKILLVHTFAHHFIRQISLSCGYPSPSLRERLYVGNDDGNMCGVLIYTASTDSEGSLGGLVSQAKDTKVLLNHIQEMVDSAKICSQDPLCSSHNPRQTEDPWGASCHSCSHLAETSCEGLQNKLLDRFALISNGSVKGYFEE